MDRRTSYHESPGRFPLVTQSAHRPVQSAHPELFSQPPPPSPIDPGHRTADFFDDTTEDEQSLDHDEQHGVGIAIDGPRHHRTRKRRSGNYLGGTTQQFHSQCGDKRK